MAVTNANTDMSLRVTPGDASSFSPDPSVVPTAVFMAPVPCSVLLCPVA